MPARTFLAVLSYRSSLDRSRDDLDLLAAHGHKVQGLYTPKEKARISAGALTSVVIVGWLVVLECRELHAGG